MGKCSLEEFEFPNLSGEQNERDLEAMQDPSLKTPNMLARIAGFFPSRGNKIAGPSAYLPLDKDGQSHELSPMSPSSPQTRFSATEGRNRSVVTTLGPGRKNEIYRSGLSNVIGKATRLQ